MADSQTSASVDHNYRFRHSGQFWDRIAFWSIILGAGLRIVWIIVIHPPVNYVYSDMRGYVLRAAQLASGAPLTPDDAFFPPGTQMLLSIPLAVFGIKIGLWMATVLWCFFSIATVYVAWRLARGLLTPAAAALTAAFCAVWPLFITYGGYFTSETPAIAFLIGALWAGTAAFRHEGRAAAGLAVLSGMLGGVASAVRPQLLLNMIILAAIMLLARRTRVALVVCLAAGLVAVTGPVIVHNSVAAGQLTGLATNGGLNFWFGHCDARSVTILDAQNKKIGAITHPVPSQAGRPGDYIVKNQNLWDEDFFIGLGRQCIEDDGLAHVLRLARNVVDMTATTIPWPQSQPPGWSRDVVRVSNLVYSVLLMAISIGSIFLYRRRGGVRRYYGELFMFVNLVCVVVVAIVVLGDPRVRTVYDVFGFALLGALLADRLHLDEPQQPTSEQVDEK